MEDPTNLEREIRAGREFSIADLIAREGGDFLKGESMIPPLVQAQHAIDVFIDRHLPDGSGALQITLKNWVGTHEALVSQHLDQPLNALRQAIAHILDHPQLLYELVKQADMKWGEIYDERPYFQQPGQPAHPEDEYTHDSVAQDLTRLLERLDQDCTLA
jgi:hypothetical protein